LVLVACDPPGKDSQVTYASDIPMRVGTISHDNNLPPEPSLPTDDQVCATLEANNAYVKRPDGALAPEADKSPAGVAVAADPAIVNPDQARIQAALDACGVSVDAEVGAAIGAADAAALAQQKADGATQSGASAEELAKPQYRASKYAVRLVVSSTGPGNGFISGPLILPSGVTLWIDKGVTLFATRDVMPFLPAGKYCANTAVGPSTAGSSGNCNALIGGKYLVNSAVMGEGSIDSRAYAEIVTSNALYPLMKVDLTCSNTYAAYKNGEKAADGTPCDDGGTIVNSQSSARNMTWWDLAWLGNMVENGRTGYGSQSNFRMMVFDWAKNLTLYRITMNNSANFHFVPGGVDGLTVWGIKLQTPSQAAYANPAGNYNPLYTGALFDEDNVKNTDAIDPSSESASALALPIIGSTATPTATSGQVMFDGYLKNVAVVYNYVSTGDDDIVLKGSKNPSADASIPGVDGNRDVASNRKWGIIIAHNHIYWGHGISIGSETNSGVANVHVYDNSFNGSEEALRIKSDYARGGEVSNIYYDHICARNILNALLFTPYYSTKAVPAAGPLFPNFHDIFVSDMYIEGASNVRLEGLRENSGGYAVPAHPLGMTLKNVVASSPDDIKVVSSEANLTLSGVNLALFPSSDNSVAVTGAATRSVDPSLVVNCDQAYVDFPSATSPFGTSWP
jgi:polygalacturonase